MRRALLPLPLLVLVALTTTTSAVTTTTSARAAGPSRDECIAAADDGQKLRDDGKLSLARDKFVLCASKACPAVIAKTCAGWREDADRDMPTATFRVMDEAGQELLDVQLLLDGATTPQPISARALPLDPGQHSVVVIRPDGKKIDEKFLLRPGEKNRMVDVKFPAPTAVTPTQKNPAGKTAPVAATDEGFHVPLLGWVGLGVGVAGGATMAIFAVMAKNDESDERAKGCAPGCPSSDKDGINTKLAVANVGMVIGIVGLGAAVVTTVLANTGKPAAKTTGIHVDASPQGMWLSGTF